MAEMVILSTCNRIEIYAVSSQEIYSELEIFLSETRGINRDGNLDAEDSPHQENKPNFTASLAKDPIDSNDVFLFHKTTCREVYESAREARPDSDDVLLYNEHGELTEFTIGNLVVELNSEFFTPPISCGLLSGTFRSHLIETGQVKERIIHKDELGKCSKIFLVNSIRKWLEVELK